jgi:SAM-dependent methyltransferase
VTTRPSYDEIGRDYARYRRADPRIAARLHRAIGAARTVVDVGAGTGSYEPPDRRVLAIEPSTVMIGQRPPGAAPVVQAVAEHLPVATGAFDAAMAVLTVHHWPDVAAGLREMTRVAEAVVILSFDPVVHGGLWLLEDYLPEVAELPSSGVPAPDELAHMVGAQEVGVVPVPADCVDGFNWAYWRRPHAYLDPAVRACISGIASLPDDLVEARMARLSRDLDDGTWLARHGDLMARPSIDGGFRLVVRRPVP